MRTWGKEVFSARLFIVSALMLSACSSVSTAPPVDDSGSSSELTTCDEDSPDQENCPEMPDKTEPGRTDPGTGTDGAGTIEFGDGTRRFLYYEPEGLPPSAPLVFMLHGYQGSAENTRRLTGLDQVADANGFAAVYPQGRDDDFGTPHWNARLDISSIDDVGFLTALAKQLQTEHGLDPERTYISGVSNGGFMSYVLAMEEPDVFRAAASIIGTMSGQSWRDRDRGSTFPLLQISGLNDQLIPFDGVTVSGGGWGGAPGMDSIISYWATRNECGAESTTDLNDGVMVEKYQECIDGNEIWLHKIDGFGHEIPSQDNGAGFNAADVVWEFFSQFP